jgi:hypothetical protein
MQLKTADLKPVTEKLKKKPEAAPELKTILVDYDAKAIAGGDVIEETQVNLPGAPALTNEALGTSIQNVERKLRESGRATPAIKQDIEKLLQRTRAQITRLRAVRKFYEANPQIVGKPAQEIKAIGKRLDHLADVQEVACKTLLAETTPQREAICFVHGFFDTIGGKAEDVCLVNSHGVTTAVAEARGEVGFIDLSDDQYVQGDYLPFFQTSVDENDKPYPISFPDLRDVQVWQDRGSMVVLGDELIGLGEAERWGRLMEPSHGVVVANIDRNKLGRRFTKTVAAALREAYTSDDEAMKNVVLAGNPPIVHHQDLYELPPVVAPASAFFAATLVRNDQFRKDLSFTSPPINPERDRLKATWLTGELLCAGLRNRGKFYDDMPFALLMLISNPRIDGIYTVFSSSRTVFGPTEHTCELQLGEMLSNAIVLHALQQFVGTNPTQEEAEAQGLYLNALLVRESGKGKAFLKARCLVSKSTIQEAVQRDDVGNIIPDEEGNPIPTGRREAVHTIAVEYREGLTHFLVVIGD